MREENRKQRTEANKRQRTQENKRQRTQENKRQREKKDENGRQRADENRRQEGEKRPEGKMCAHAESRHERRQLQMQGRKTWTATPAWAFSTIGDVSSRPELLVNWLIG